MAPADPDRNLLFGLLALQNGLIDQSRLVAGFQAWTLDRSRALADHLLEGGAIDPEQRGVLEAMVDLHLKWHGGRATESLAAIPAAFSTRDTLAVIADRDLMSTLAHVGSSRAGDRPGFEHRAQADLPDGAAGGPVPPNTEARRFRILRPHARGGLGIVSVAMDTELHREVALKQILESHADDPSSRQRFLLEAEVTGNLEHPGIVPVYGLGTHADGRPYYAMRFIRGETLKEAIERFQGGRGSPGAGEGSLELHKLLRRFIDVCNAIDFAHSRGVLHRDIKPSNIIVGPHGETLVVDWGLAKAIGRSEPAEDSRTWTPRSAGGSSATHPGSAMGTPSYMSPEQANGRLDLLGARSDVYSLGATLYTLLTGKPPFTGTLADVIRGVQCGAFRPPRALDPAIDRAMEAICLKAMALESDDRYPTARALAEDVERWMVDEPATAWREPASRRARRWARRHRTSVAGAAAALMAGIIGLASVLAVQSRANAGLAAKNAQLEQANVALNEARANVQARFGLAMDAIRTFHTGVSKDAMLKEPGLKELRTRLLRSASSFYSRLTPLLEKATDFASRRSLQQANFDVAELAGNLGEISEAMAAHRRVLAAREALAAEAGADPEIETDLGRSLTTVAGLLDQVGQTDPALDTYRAAIDRLTGQSASPDARTALADCRARLGDLLHRAGRGREALDELHLARSDLEAIADSPVAATEQQQALGQTCYNLGAILRETGQEQQALAEHRAALTIRRKLAHDHPDVSSFREDLGRSHDDIGWLLANAGRPDAAMEQYRQALAIHQVLADDNPAVTAYRRELAYTHHAIGTLYSNTARPIEALAGFRAALPIRRKLADEHPSVSSFRNDLCWSLHNIAVLLVRSGHPAEALEPFREEMKLREELVRESPEISRYRDALANAATDAANALLVTGHAAEARPLCEQAVAIDDAVVAAEPHNTEFSARLVEALLRRGQVRRAEGDFHGAAADWRRGAAIFAALPPQRGENRVLAACCHAGLSGLGDLSGSGVSPAEASASADRAMDLLRQAAAIGSRDLPWIRTESGLDPLRSRAEFRDLLMDLAWPEQPFAPPG